MAKQGRLVAYQAARAAALQPGDVRSWSHAPQAGERSAWRNCAEVKARDPAHEPGRPLHARIVREPVPPSPLAHAGEARIDAKLTGRRARAGGRQGLAR